MCAQVKTPEGPSPQPTMAVLPGHWLKGNIDDLQHNPFNWVRDAVSYGDVVRFRFGPFMAMMANHPEAIHDVLVTNAQHFYKTRVAKYALKETLGNGLFTNDGDSWRNQRRLMQPAFHSRRISDYATSMVDYADQVGHTWADAQHIDLEHDMTLLTMRIVMKTLFDADASDEADELGHTVTRILKIANDRFNRPVQVPHWLPTTENRTLRHAVGRLDETILRIIEARRTTNMDRGDLLSMILMAQGEDGQGMSDQQVRDEAVTIFGAGHETTAVALTWTWYLLSQNPSAEAQLHAELDAVLGERLPTFADLPNLPYTEQIIKEALRLYPPAFLTSREAVQDTSILGHPVKKGAIVVVNFYGAHMDARWFPEPERFDPERFSPEREKQLPRYAYMPFGAGPRICIGNAFAMMEARLILATLARHYRLRLAPGHVVAPQRHFTLRPRYGMKMVVEARQPMLA